jgi:hypothetical protein
MEEFQLLKKKYNSCTKIIHTFRVFIFSYVVLIIGFPGVIITSFYTRIDIIFFILGYVLVSILIIIFFKTTTMNKNNNIKIQ